MRTLPIKECKAHVCASPLIYTEINKEENEKNSIYSEARKQPCPETTGSKHYLPNTVTTEPTGGKGRENKSTTCKAGQAEVSLRLRCPFLGVAGAEVVGRTPG